MSHGSSVNGLKVMAFSYHVRDALTSRRPYLEEAGVLAGMTVLDFGCGPGSYAVLVAGMLGATGRVYALDANSSAPEMKRRRAARKRLRHMQTILSECSTDLPHQSVDVALLYHRFHDPEDATGVPNELHRVLKASGVLPAHDHHLERKRLQVAVKASGLFRLTHTGALTLTFAPERKGR